MRGISPDTILYGQFRRGDHDNVKSWAYIAVAWEEFDEKLSRSYDALRDLKLATGDAISQDRLKNKQEGLLAIKKMLAESKDTDMIANPEFWAKFEELIKTRIKKFHNNDSCIFYREGMELALQYHKELRKSYSINQ